MAINFPTSLDVFTDPTASDQLNLPSHSGQHTDLNNAVEALEAKVGADGSAVTTSHDYKIAQLEAGATGGKILQVVSTTKTDTFSASVSAGGTVDITGLTATITPTSASSTILVYATVHGSNSSTQRGQISFLIQRDSTPVLVGATAGSRTSVSGYNYIHNTHNNESMSGASIVGMDSPATTSAITYKITAHLPNNATNTVLVNRTWNDADANYTARPISTLTLMEVSA
jgi:hypothetical protein